MNYQIMHVMEEYDPELDQMLLFYLPLAGSTFKKIYYDATLGRAVSKVYTSRRFNCTLYSYKFRRV